MNPCARESKARTGRFLKEKLISNHDVFSANKERRTGNIPEKMFSRDAQGFKRLDAGSCAGFTSSRPPPLWTLIFRFFYFCMTYGLEKLGLVDQNYLERDLSALLLRTLAVGRRQQSKSIEFVLDME